MSITKKILKQGWAYCYMSGDQAVFLNRWDEVIEIFETYKEAEDYANENIHLIDVPKPKAYHFRNWNKDKVYDPQPNLKLNL